MKKLFSIILCLLLFAGNGWAAYENFSTDWTETDPNSRLSQTATRSTATGINHDENAFLAKNSASFTGDWDFAFDFRIDSSSDTSDYTWTFGLLYLSDGTYYYGVDTDEASAGKVRIVLYEPTNYAEDTTTLNEDTVYYARYRRDESIGTYGRIYLDIYPTSADRTAGTNVVLQQQVDITSAKRDLNQMFATGTYDGNDVKTITFYLENLDLAYVPTPTVNTLLNNCLLNNALIQ